MLKKAMLHTLHLCLSVSLSLSQTSGLLRLTMDKSGMAKSNYEEKLYSCPRNHVCQRPHNETQGLLKWAWQAQRILIFFPLILSPCTCIIKPFLIKATIWKWWMVIQIGNAIPRGVCDTEEGWLRGRTHAHTNKQSESTKSHAHTYMDTPLWWLALQKAALAGLIGVLTKMR